MRWMNKNLLGALAVGWGLFGAGVARADDVVLEVLSSKQEYDNRTAAMTHSTLL